MLTIFLFRLGGAMQYLKGRNWLLNHVTIRAEGNMFGNAGIVCWSLLLSFACNFAVAEDDVLFNGSDLTGWTFQVRDDEDNPKPVEQVWIVKDGLLISRGTCNGFLKHEAEFENYELTIEWRSMQLNGQSGLIVGGSGSLFVHTTNEDGSFNYPKSIEIGMFHNPGMILFRDVDPFSEEEWAFRASEVVDEVEKDMDEWNQMKVICRGDQITVFINGTPVNQVSGLNSTKGSIALQSQTATFEAPSYYRNIRVRPLPEEPTEEEKLAGQKLTQFKKAAEDKRAEQERMRRDEEQREAMREEELNKLWATIEVEQDLEFSNLALELPFPADARDVQFDTAFEDIELRSSQSLAELSKFYRTELARRGWKETEKDRDEDSIEVTLQHGDSEVDLTLDKESDGVEITLSCSGLSFKGANDPAKLASIGFKQPAAYLYLQKEFKLPENARDVEFDSGNEYLFKSDLQLQQAFDFLKQQLQAKGFSESRRPIITDDRRYTEFTKGSIEISINIFSHESGSRVIVSYEND